jgi:hypothetical protein
MPAFSTWRREFAPYDSGEELALKIFCSAQDLEKNRVARLNVRKRSTATDAASFLAMQLLGNREIEVRGINRPEFHFSMKREADVELTA